MKIVTVGPMTLNADKWTHDIYTRMRDVCRAAVSAPDPYYTDNDRWTDYRRMIGCAEVMSALEEAGA